MKKLLLILSLSLAGCSPEIRCWYATSYSQSIGEPWYALDGLRTTMMSDIQGPKFKTQAELEAYVKTHNLKLCGSN